jgi:hypothetical protein
MRGLRFQFARDAAAKVLSLTLPGLVFLLINKEVNKYLQVRLRTITLVATTQKIKTGLRKNRDSFVLVPEQLKPFPWRVGE